jgi:glycosyltransferase involved in cell wall biosynthesis
MTWLDDRFALPARWLRRIVTQWRPDIVHSLPLDPAGRLARAALQDLPESVRPSWVASAWGSDLNVGLVDEKRRPNVEFILRNCDGFMADCRHDLELAERTGLAPSKRALADAAPGNGGVDIELFARIRAASSRRDVIVIPKAFEREHANRTFTVIEALRSMGPAVLDGFEIHLLMCSSGVRNWLTQMPSWLQERCRCHATLPQRDFFDLLGRARVVVSPSLADGTANVMLEAMAGGALPLMSPLPSTQEWMTDGRNGLTAHALYPDQIAAALTRALTDEDLFQRASRENWDLVRERADRRDVARRVLAYYRALIAQ